jgi:hypothetical protein
MLTKRKRFFWAAWWTAAPKRIPYQKPDASNGGAATREEAVAAAESAAGRTLVEVDARWARGWMNMLRGQTPFTTRDIAWLEGGIRPREAPTPSASSMWTLLGVARTASVAEIKVAFRKRALETHPDQGGDAEDFRALKRAYDAAVEKAKRPKKKTRSSPATTATEPKPRST